MDAIREDVPACLPCIIPRGTTSILQPCDLAYFRPFKEKIRHDLATGVVKDIMASVDVGTHKIITKLPRLKANLLPLVHAGMQHINSEELRIRAWKHLETTLDEHCAILEEAELEWEAGTLMEDHRPQLQVELERKIHLKKNAMKMTVELRMMTSIKKKIKSNSPSRKPPPDEAPAAEVPTAAVDDQPRLERSLERDAPLISRFVALRLVYGNRAPS
eukprot:502201-Amphidinium_carterae.1